MTVWDLAVVVYSGLAFLVLALTFLPELDVTRWWVRALDVPRLQIAVIAVGLLMLAPAFPAVPWLGIIALGVSVLWQAWKIHPYTPLVTKEIQLAKTGGQEASFMAWNVKMENTDHAAARDLITTESPDVILLMETDDTWATALESVLKSYPTVVLHARDNHYGMIFATRLVVEEARIVYLTADDTPTLLARLIAPNGQAFRFVGLHPRPPLPGTDSDFRDSQMLYAARFARKSGLPVVTMGDFNAAAWSRISRHFKRVGEFVDPRVGRSLVASFDARSRLLRCPIDQLYVTPDIAVTGFRRGPHVGSDHFPMFATLCMDATLAARLNRAPPALDDSARAAMQSTCRDYEGWLRKAHLRQGVDARYSPFPPAG